MIISVPCVLETKKPPIRFQNRRQHAGIAQKKGTSHPCVAIRLHEYNPILKTIISGMQKTQTLSVCLNIPMQMFSSEIGLILHVPGSPFRVKLVLVYKNFDDMSRKEEGFP